jgi:hypothetical protein
MFIRNINGKLIKINKYEFSSDIIYYGKIMKIKKDFTKPVENENENKVNSKTTDLICKFIKL